MSVASIREFLIKSATSLAQPAVSPLRLYQRWILPQLFVFVALFVSSIIGHEDDKLLFSRLCSITYLLISGIVWLSRKRKVLSLDFIIQLLGLVVLVTGLALWLRCGAFLSVGLPVSLLILSGIVLSFSRLVFMLAAMICTMALLVAFTVPVLTQSIEIAEVLISIGLIWMATLVAIFIKEMFRHNTEQFGNATNHLTSVAEPYVLTLEDSNNQKQEETELLGAIGFLRRCHSLELLSEFGWRLAVVMLILMALLLDSLVVPKPIYALAWLVSSVLVVLLLIVACKARSLISIIGVGLVCVVVSIGWWFVTSLSENGQFLSQSVLFITIILFVSLPWPFLLSVVLTFCFSILILYQAVYVSHSALSPLILFSALLFAWRLGQISDFVSLARVIAVSTARQCLQSTNALAPLQLLTSQFSLLMGGGQAILILEGGDWQVWYSNGMGKRFKFTRVADSIFEQVTERGIRETICSGSFFGQHSVSQLIDSFGGLPQKIYVCVVTITIFGLEQRAIIITPVSMKARLIGPERALKVLSGLCMSVRSLITVTQTSSQSSDLATNTQKALAEREHQFSRVIHSINNAVQDVTVISDGMQKIFNKSISLEEMQLEAGDKLYQINQLAHLIAYQVTDFKLLREMVNLKPLAQDNREPAVRADEVLREFASFAKFVCDRNGINHCLEHIPQTSFRVHVVGSHYLEATLRCLLQHVVKSANAGSEFYLDVELGSEDVILRMGNRAVHSLEESSGVEMALSSEHVEAVKSFVVASGGALSFQENCGLEVVMKLRRCTISDNLANTKSSGWCLFVDDSEQIITFYQHVADVLELNYSTATTLAEARGLIEDCGKPTLVVTDLQLGAETGLSLIKELRDQFDDSVAIIVVSGDIESIRNEKEISGADNVFCLAKPLSRRKLFGAIQSLLRETVV